GAVNLALKRLERELKSAAQGKGVGLEGADAVVEGERSHGRLKAQARAHHDLELAQVELGGLGPEVADVREQTAVKAAHQREPELVLPGDEGLAAAGHHAARVDVPVFQVLRDHL